MFDPIITLAFVAADLAHPARHERAHHAVYTPVVLAKQLATLDVLSRGRLDVGLGLGWSMDEYEAVGVPYRGAAGAATSSCAASR